jgi:hypothetical protein
LKPSTVKQKGHAVIGLASGRSHLTDPATYRDAPRDILPREATWKFPDGDTRDIARGWQLGDGRRGRPARKLVGWTRAALDQADQLLRAADFAARE